MTIKYKSTYALLLFLTGTLTLNGAWHFRGTPFNCTPYIVGPSAHGPGGGMACTLLASCINNAGFTQNITLAFKPKVGWDCTNGVTITGVVEGEASSFVDPLNDQLRNSASSYLYRPGGSVETWTTNAWRFCDGTLIDSPDIYYGPGAC